MLQTNGRVKLSELDYKVLIKLWLNLTYYVTNTPTWQSEDLSDYFFLSKMVTWLYSIDFLENGLTVRKIKQTVKRVLSSLSFEKISNIYHSCRVICQFIGKWYLRYKWHVEDIKIKYINLLMFLIILVKYIAMETSNIGPGYF